MPFASWIRSPDSSSPRSYGCGVVAGGKHSKKIVDVPSGTVIPIPMHGKYVQEAYIKELKDLFAEIESRRREVD